MAGVAGRSGRKPKPVARKLAAGNPGERAFNRDAPDFGRILDIDAPPWLSGEANEMWERIVPKPLLLRSDNGLVFTSRSYTALVRGYGLRQEFITPTVRSTTEWSNA